MCTFSVNEDLVSNDMLHQWLTISRRKTFLLDEMHPKRHIDSYPSKVAAMEGMLRLLHISRYRSTLRLILQDLQKEELKLSTDI